MQRVEFYVKNRNWISIESVPCFRSTRVTACFPECIERGDRKEPFECSVCDREFKHHSAVVLHEARHVIAPSGGGGQKESNDGVGDTQKERTGNCETRDC